MPKVKTKFGQENKLIHPNSRKADQISREWHRDVRVKHNKKAMAQKMTALGEKIAWFRDQLDPDVTVYTIEQTADLVERYLGRFDEELEQIRLKNQIGQRSSRQHASREDAIELSQKLEKDEYEGCGLEIPDLSNPKNLEYLRSWTGVLRFIPNITLKRFRKPQDKGVNAKSDTPSTAEEEVGRRDDKTMEVA